MSALSFLVSSFSSMIVLVATIIFTLVIWLMDFIAGGGLNFLYKTLYS